jgi:uncharacterized protein involved in type VI secretion and phage assembly
MMIHDELLRSLLAPHDADGRLHGVMVGVVTNNNDPEGLHRVKVRFPWLSPSDDSHWARVATPMAGGKRGCYFLPEVDDEVLVAFEHGNVDHPFVLGALWNGKDEATESNDNGSNDNRSLTSRSGHVIRFGDKAGGEKLEIIDKTGNNRIVITSSSNKIAIEAQGDIEITSSTGKLKMSAIGVEIDSKAGVKIQAQTTVDVSATAQVSVKGALVKIN